ncbi:MAG: nucleotide-binding protein [Methanoregulaceae archaeon]
MKRVLDSSFFFADYPFDGELFTTPSVVGELVDLSAKCRFENLLAQGLTVQEPVPEALEKVGQASRKTGDGSVLSATDRNLLALALDTGATLHTDDFAVQNVAHALGIPVAPLRQRRADPIRWKFRCTGCGRYYRETGECPVCGAVIKRKLK